MFFAISLHVLLDGASELFSESIWWPTCGDCSTLASERFEPDERSPLGFPGSRTDPDRRGEVPCARAAGELCSARNSTIARRAASSSSADIVLCWYRYRLHSSCRCARFASRSASTLPLPERLRFRLPVLRLAASVSIAWLSSISSALGDGAGPLPGNSLSRAFSSSFCRCRARSTACRY